jgi:hypothetical protein
MLKKTITYTDYNGVEQTEDFWFNLSKAELLEKEMGAAGGLEDLLRKIIASKDQERITNAFKQIILKSYGEKSEDGKRFIKKRNGVMLSEEFEQTEAYSELFTELSTDADAAAAFVTGILPRELAQAAANQIPQATLPPTT